MNGSFWQWVKCALGKHDWLYNDSGNEPVYRLGTVRVCRGLTCQVIKRLVLEGADFVWRPVEE